jgi:predicted nucleic acid-binding Zn ribbon protein
MNRGEKMNIPVHIYECDDCILVFAVEMAFEDQSEIKCPNCGNEEINDVAAGEMIFRRDNNVNK